MLYCYILSFLPQFPGQGGYSEGALSTHTLGGGGELQLYHKAESHFAGF